MQQYLPGYQQAISGINPSYQQGAGAGIGLAPDPFAGLSAAMNRLAAALEKRNELDSQKGTQSPAT